MDRQRREITIGDRVAAGILIAGAAGIGVVAPVLAAPLALENGWLTPRFALFLAATIAAWWLGGSVAVSVLRRLRRSGGDVHAPEG